MPKIILQGELHPITVSPEDAQRILEQKNDSNYKSLIKIGIREVSKGKIKEVIFTNETAAKGYDLNDPADRAKIVEFERQLSEIAQKSQLIQPIERFGRPHAEFVKLHPERAQRPGFVFNPLLGLVHWSVVNHAIQENMISEKNGNWSIIDYGMGEHTDIANYKDFENKLRALGDLRGRRAYAQRKELDSIIESKNEFASATTVPVDEIQIELPF